MMTHGAHVARALGYFGPMTIPQIVEKVKAYIPNFTQENAEQVIRVHCDEFMGFINPASGFSEPTYKVMSIDMWKRMTYGMPSDENDIPAEA